MSNFTPNPDKTNHKVTEDKLIQALVQNRPVGSSQHRDELETRLLGLLTEQSETNHERHPNMHAQVRSPYIISLYKMRVSPILVATLTMIIIGAGLLFANGGSNTPSSSLEQISTQTSISTSTPIGATCKTNAIVRLETIVYAEDSLNAEQLGTYQNGEHFSIIGQNFTGEWLVIEWSDEYVGWIQNMPLDKRTFDVSYCDDVQIEDPNNLPPTALPPTMVPPTTPIDTTAESEYCELYQVYRAQLLSESSIYARPTTDAEVLETMDAGNIIDVIGVNRAQDWFVIHLDADYVGWVEIGEMEFLMCGVIEPMPFDIQPTVLPPIAMSPVEVDITATSTPISTMMLTATPLP